MNTSSPFLLAPLAPDTNLQTAIDWSTALTQSMVDSQRLAWETVFALHKAMFDLQQELWDEWACRFAGGVPLDG